MSRAVRSLPAVTAMIEPSSSSTRPSSGSGHRPARLGAHGDRLVRADRAAAACVLEEQLGSLGVVDERVHVGRGRALLDARVPAALVGHARRPDLGRRERGEQRQRRERRRILGDVLGRRPRPRSARGRAGARRAGRARATRARRPARPGRSRRGAARARRPAGRAASRVARTRPSVREPAARVVERGARRERHAVARQVRDQLCDLVRRARGGPSGTRASM